jgi:DNA replication and repair protein RecF
VLLVEITTAGFRNLHPGGARWSPGSNLVFGGNGEGKTNLLEAVTVLGNLRSFRTPSMRRLVAHGETEFLLEGRVETSTGTVRLSQRVGPGPPVRRDLRIGGSTTTVGRYLRVFPVFALAGADRDLVLGGPSERRAFLDRLAFLLEDEHLDELRRYRQLLRHRNAALERSADDVELEVWEQRLASAAATLIERRTRVCDRLVEVFQPIYLELRSRGFPEIELRYRGGAELESAENARKLEDYYQKRYTETRARDRRMGFTNEGPHRHDLGLRTDGRTVRDVLSSGQVKLVAAALRLASLQLVERVRGELLPVIIDDVDAELDAAVVARLIGFLDGERQLFLSSADSGVFTMLATGACRFEIRRGEISGPAGERLDE